MLLAHSQVFFKVLAAKAAIESILDDCRRDNDDAMLHQAT
jgi:hypothetical protein